MLQPGTLIGRYEIQRQLGRGGMGTVYVAHDPVLGRMVAVKVFLGDLDLSDATERFTREARSAAALNHANIVTIHDYGELESQPYIVMEYIQGDTLTEIIRRKAPVPLAEKLRWIEELCTGVSYAHRVGVIHRDIKPTNLMIDRSGRLKILDFGIARILGKLASNATSLIGTPGYMAPEQILGGTIDYRSDLFSIGVVSYELLCYAEAFPGDTFPTVTHRVLSEDPVPLTQLVPDLHPDLVAIVERSLKKRADERFSDAEALRLAISNVRRQFDNSSGWDAAPTLMRGDVPPTGATRPGTGSQRSRVPDPIGVAQLTPPPNKNREEILRRRTSRIEAALAQARGLLQAGEIEAALEACAQALTIDETHREALELERAIQAALGKQRAGVLIGEARDAIGKGGLTGAQNLLQQARALDPGAPDLKQLERELRLARVEQERLRQRASAVTKALDAANHALGRGDIEAALAFAREALQLDPNSAKARAVEANAMRRLDEEIGATGVEIAPTVISSAVLPRPGSADAASVAVPPTIVAPAARRAPLPLGVRTKIVLEAVGRYEQALYVPLRDMLRSVLAGAKARPKREIVMLGWTAAAVFIIAVVIGGIMLMPRPAPPTGTMMIDAIPWARIAAIEAPDGTRPALPSTASTPMFFNLPVGTYRIRLIGPPPALESRLITVQVNVGAVATAPIELFRTLAPEEYFKKYLQSSPPSPSDVPSQPDRTGRGENP